MMATQDVEELARETAGNWQRFDSFSWWGRNDDLIPDPEHWMIWMTSSRDSDLAEQSNAAAIDKELERFTRGNHPSVVPMSSGHWAVGHVDGYAVRVYRRDGKTLTKAFLKACEIKEALEDYPLLDESDHSKREYEATLKNIADVGRSEAANDGHDLPDGWEKKVFRWLWDNDQSEVVCRDGGGGYPSEKAVHAALVGCNLIPDPDTYPVEGVDLVTLDRHNFFLAGYESRGCVLYVPEGADWRTLFEEYREGDVDIGAWLVTGPDLTDCEYLDPEE